VLDDGAAVGPVLCWVLDDGAAVGPVLCWVLDDAVALDEAEPLELHADNPIALAAMYATATVSRRLTFIDFLLSARDGICRASADVSAPTTTLIADEVVDFRKPRPALGRSSATVEKRRIANVHKSRHATAQMEVLMDLRCSLVCTSSPRRRCDASYDAARRRTLFASL
jgi:hypothetical protein